MKVAVLVSMVVYLFSAQTLAGGVDGKAPAPRFTTASAQLSCGGAAVTARATQVDVGDEDTQVVSQQITMMPPGMRDSVVLALDGKPMHQSFLSTDVLDAAVESWACLKADDGRAYVLLLFICTQSQSRPACAGSAREWPRLFDVQGRPLNASDPHAGPAWVGLMNRLHLQRYLHDGVPMQDLNAD